MTAFCGRASARSAATILTATCIFIDGIVSRKFVEDGKHLVEISQNAETHRGELSATGVAIVELPEPAFCQLNPVRERASR